MSCLPSFTGFNCNQMAVVCFYTYLTTAANLGHFGWLCQIQAGIIQSLNMWTAVTHRLNEIGHSITTAWMSSAYLGSWTLHWHFQWNQRRNLVIVEWGWCDLLFAGSQNTEHLITSMDILKNSTVEFGNILANLWLKYYTSLIVRMLHPAVVSLFA